MAREHNYFVYLLTNANRTVLYIGVTNDLARRIEEHQSGERPGFTQRYRLNRLVYYELYPDARAAIEREKQLKGWTRAKKELLVAQANPKWMDLSGGL